MNKGKIAYTWYQTNYVVGVELNQPVQTKEQIKHLFNSNSCEVILKIDNETEVQLNLDLFDEIDVEKSTVNFNLQKVELKLVKKVPNKNWPHLEAIEKIVQNQNQPLSVEEKQTFNASSAKVKRDWNKIDKDLEKEIEEDLKTDPLQHLFKQIYGNADEQTKKAMIKSFQTSGGTVLSTNWDEVSKKDYEGKDRPEAPKGQQWNKSEM